MLTASSLFPHHTFHWSCRLSSVCSVLKQHLVSAVIVRCNDFLDHPKLRGCPPYNTVTITTVFTATVILPPALDRHIGAPEEFLLIAVEGQISTAHSPLPAAADDDKLVVSFPPLSPGCAVTNEQPRLCTMLHLSSWLVETICK